MTMPLQEAIGSYHKMIGDIPKPNEKPNRVLKSTFFSVGPGPCGKEVTRLDVSFEPGLLGIQQTTEDGATKGFIYKLDDIAGRMEVVV